MQRWRRKTDLNTGQMSAIVRVSFQSLYVYVRTFPEFFSESARQHTQGRRWTIEDLEMVQSIRCLYHERAGTEKIRELLASGWRLQNVQIWTRELITLLLDQTLKAQEEAKNSAKDLISLKKLMDDRKINDRQLKEMWIDLQDLKLEWKIMQKAWRSNTNIQDAVRILKKKKYHGEPPDLYMPGKTESS